jgi:hypothetical protein
MIYSFYDKLSGVLHTKKFIGPAEWVQHNTPPGHAAIEGDFDPVCHRVNVIERPGTVERFQPPSPGDDHIWDSNAWKWTQHPDAVARQQEHERALGEIHRLEQLSLRGMRELLLKSTWGTAYRNERMRLVEADEAIDEQRKKLITS